MLVDSEEPTAVLLDFAKPGINGAEAARRPLARQADIRIAFATGFARSDAIDMAVDDDAIVLSMPFSPVTLADPPNRAISV